MAALADQHTYPQPLLCPQGPDSRVGCPTVISESVQVVIFSPSLSVPVSSPQETSFPTRVQPRRCNLGPVCLVSSCPRHMLVSSHKRWLQESRETQERPQLASQLSMPQSPTFPRGFTLLLAESTIPRIVRSSKTLAT